MRSKRDYDLRDEDAVRRRDGACTLLAPRRQGNKVTGQRPLTHVSILTANHRQQHLVYLTPLLVNRGLLREMGVTFSLYCNEEDALVDADCILFENTIFRRWGKEAQDEKAFGLLDRMRQWVDRVIWFDATDGTGTTQFQLLPYVDRYLKHNVLKDRSQYQRRYYGGSIYTDYYHREFGVDDSDEFEPPVPAQATDLHKIEVGWGHALADYGRWAPVLRRVRKYVPLPTFYSQRMVAPDERTERASFRFGTRYRRETVAFQRQLVKDRAASLGFDTDKIPRPDYLKELRKCKLAVSPFGWGEPSYKDYEVILNGAALLKPDMSHMETWPNIYVEGDTYLPFKWDCSDLEAVIDSALSQDRWRQVAARAQTVYGRYLFEREGREEFCDRFGEMVRS